MKPGAGDDPFADTDADDEQQDANAQDDSDDGAVDMNTTASSDPAESREMSGGSRSQTSATATELPYKYRRSSVKDGRTQQPMFLQGDTEDLIAETVAEVEQRFDEEVYKTDVVEAMIVAGGEETTPAAVLQRWGYGMKNS